MKYVGKSKLTALLLVISCACFGGVVIPQVVSDPDHEIPSDGLTEVQENAMLEILKVYNKTSLTEVDSNGISEFKYWKSFKEDGLNFGLKILSDDPNHVIVSLTKIHDDSTWYKFSKAYMDDSELKFLIDTKSNQNFELTKGFKFKKEWADFSVKTEILIENSCGDVGAEFVVVGERQLELNIPKPTLQGFLIKAKRLGADIGEACLEVELEAEKDATPKDESLEQHAFIDEYLERNS